MSTKIQNGGPAFPSEYNVAYHRGMYLRDWFAGQALIGNLSADRVMQYDALKHAKWAYEIADAMIEKSVEPNE